MQRSRTRSRSFTRSLRPRLLHPQAPYPPAHFSACASTVSTRILVDTPISPSRTAATHALADVVVRTTPVHVPARHPLSLTRAEHEALTLQSQSPLSKSSPNDPASASAVPFAPTRANKVFVPKPSEETRPYTVPLLSHSASHEDVSTASSATAVMAAHSSPKPHKSRSRKRRAEQANLFVKSATRQAAPSGPVLP